MYAQRYLETAASVSQPRLHGTPFPKIYMIAQSVCWVSRVCWRYICWVPSLTVAERRALLSLHLRFGAQYKFFVIIIIIVCHTGEAVGSYVVHALCRCGYVRRGTHSVYHEQRCVLILQRVAEWVEQWREAFQRIQRHTLERCATGGLRWTGLGTRYASLPLLCINSFLTKHWLHSVQLFSEH